MTRTNIIQLLIDKIQAKKYLEIGVGGGINFSNIKCEHKVCVDPTPTVPVTFILTSDDFFAQNKETFDIIFIDGLHWSEQVYKDIINSLEILTDGGYIVCHDICPSNEVMQRYPPLNLNSEWTGDCWRAWVKLKTERNDLDMFVVDTDYGCGIIKKGKQNTIKIDSDLTWDFFEANKKNLLNLISVENFEIILNNSSKIEK